jgi:hypothetical protein
MQDKKSLRKNLVHSKPGNPGFFCEKPKGMLDIGRFYAIREFNSQIA